MNRVLHLASRRNERVMTGIVGLLVAGVLVAVAISMEGTVSRGINGVGALVWLGSTAWILAGLRGQSHWWTSLILAVTVTLVLSFVVEPTDIATAVPGFAAGGAILALVARPPVAWAFMVPALWLPVHLLTAVVPAIIRAVTGGEASVRTDPPPTAAVVPLLMIVAAGCAGWLIGILHDRRRQGQRVVSRGA